MGTGSGDSCENNRDSHGAEKTWLQRAMMQRRTARAAPGTFMLLSRVRRVGSFVRGVGLGTGCCLCPAGV